MEKTLALIHTAPVLTPVFNELVRERLDGVRVFHMVDESLIKNTIRAGRLEKTTIRRLVRMIESASEAGADAVLVTCSSIGAGVPAARPLFDIPVFRIDEAMAEAAVAAGRRIGVIATLATTLEPTVGLLAATARHAGRDCEIIPHLCEGAFEKAVSGDTEGHDRAVKEALALLAREVDVIVFAQASMARVANQLPPGSLPVPVLSSPALAIDRVRQILIAENRQ